jgi:hypothetical protein
MAAQMLLELAIGEIEADTQCDQHSRRTINAPSMASPCTYPAREPNMRGKTSVHSRSFDPRPRAPHAEAPFANAEKVFTLG